MREGARRNGVLSGIKKWPNARIPYAISSEYNERERAVSISNYYSMKKSKRPWTSVNKTLSFRSGIY